MKLNSKSFAAFWKAHGHRWFRDGYMPSARRGVVVEILEAWEAWKGAEQLEMFKGRPS